MVSFLEPLDIPKRLSLPNLAAGSIRKGITQGTWEDCLPSERQLCSLFQVSRPTIRSALHLLAKEGLVGIHRGRRNRILAPSFGTANKQSRLVGLVAHVPFSQLTLPAYQGISEMRAQLVEHGFSTVTLICPQTPSQIQRLRLNEFVHQNRLSCCVLLSVNVDIQEWFSTQAIPTLVLGSCHAGVRLPSLDVDYSSVCRHAAGTLFGKGHRRIALLVPDSGVAGDLASEKGFRDAAEAHLSRDRDSAALVIRHNDTVKDINRKLDAHFTPPLHPTAIIVAKPQFVFAVIIHLLRRGLTVPDDVSLIARDHDRMFDNVSPPITHYVFGEETYAHRLCRLMLQTVNEGNLPPEPNLIFPTFSPGGTLKAVRSVPVEPSP